MEILGNRIAWCRLFFFRSLFWWIGATFAFAFVNVELAIDELEVRCVQIIMIMKRNTRQITFLHVYHHSSISLIWWAIAHHAPGGEGKLFKPKLVFRFQTESFHVKKLDDVDLVIEVNLFEWCRCYWLGAVCFVSMQHISLLPWTQEYTCLCTHIISCLPSCGTILKFVPSTSSGASK